jgi:DNA-binding MarR family transcriptional regulator
MSQSSSGAVAGQGFAPPASAGTVMQEAAEFHRAFQDLLRLQQSRDRERVGGYGVTVSGAHAVEVLTRLGPVSLNALAAELFVDKSTASRIVALLEDLGFVRRAVDARDRRVLRLELTPEGARLSRQLTDDAVWEMHALLYGFPPDVRAGMLAFLRQLTRTSATHAGATGASCLAEP